MQLIVNSPIDRGLAPPTPIKRRRFCASKRPLSTQYGSRDPKFSMRNGHHRCCRLAIRTLSASGRSTSGDERPQWQLLAQLPSFAGLSTSFRINNNSSSRRAEKWASTNPLRFTASFLSVLSPCANVGPVPHLSRAVIRPEPSQHLYHQMRVPPPTSRRVARTKPRTMNIIPTSPV